MIEEIKFHNAFIKQIKAWMNETKNKKQSRLRSRRLRAADVLARHELSQRNQIDLYLIPRGSLEDFSEGYVKSILKNYKLQAIMIAEQYSASSKREIPENLRNKILMFKL